MALPSAPLGQMPNMNMPYAMPRYEQPANVWEKALAAFLVNAAGGVAQQGAQNVMERDYASEFGEKPASGFSRLLGAKVPKDVANSRRNIRAQADEATLGRTFADEQAKKQQTFTEQQNLLSRQQQAGLSQAEIEAGNLRQAESIWAAQDLQAVKDKASKEEWQARLLAEAPLRESQGGYYDASARRLGGQADFSNQMMQGLFGGKTPPGQVSAAGVVAENTGASGLTPADMAAMEKVRQASKGASTSSAPALPIEQQIMQRLQAGENPDQVALDVERQQKIQERVAALEAQNTRKAKLLEQTQQNTVYDIMRKAGIVQPINTTRRDLNSIF